MERTLSSKSGIQGFRNRIGWGTFLLIVLDFLTVLCVFYLSVGIRENVVPVVFKNAPPFSPEPLKYSWIILLWMIILAYNGGYTQRFSLWDEVKFLWNSVLLISVVIFTVLFIRKVGVEFSRALILNMCFLSLVLHPPARILSKRFLYRIGLLKRKLLIIGSGQAAKSSMLAIRNEPNLGYEVAGFIDDGPQNCRQLEGVKVHRFADRVETYIRRCRINDVLIATPEMDKEDLVSLINRVQHIAENTFFIPDITGIAVLGLQVRNFFGEQALVLEVKNQLARPLNYFSKRLLDYLAGCVLFLLLALPMLAMSLLIRLTSRGPAIFKQERVGRHGRHFMCYKFRTMYEDAEERLNEVLAGDPKVKQEWETYCKLKDDPRVTRVGRFLRMTSLDELPQLINVLRGEMSIVGPRPVMQEEIDNHYREEAGLCFSVPPGITGLWQVSGRSDISYDRRVVLDSWYVRNWTLWLDIVILLKTVMVVIRAQNAY